MPNKNSAREILRKAIHKSTGDYLPSVFVVDEEITQALSALHSLIVGEMPKEKETYITRVCTTKNDIETSKRNASYNQAISDCLKALDKIFGIEK